jgi:hypothetical protein
MNDMCIIASEGSQGTVIEGSQGTVIEIRVGVLNRGLPSGGRARPRHTSSLE